MHQTPNYRALVAYLTKHSDPYETHAALFAQWLFLGAEWSEHDENCVCGQTIREMCFIQNKYTGHRTWIGNVCIHHVLGAATANAVSNHARVLTGRVKSYNPETIDFLYSKEILNDWEVGFIKDIRLDRRLSSKQAACKTKIFAKIAAYFTAWEVAEQTNEQNKQASIPRMWTAE